MLICKKKLSVKQAENRALSKEFVWKFEI